MSFWRYLIFAAIIVLLGWGLAGVFAEQRKLEGTAGTLRAELTALEGENTGLESDISYYERPENLVKALKEQFNYRAPDERLIILVSPSTSTGTSTE